MSSILQPFSLDQTLLTLLTSEVNPIFFINIFLFYVIRSLFMDRNIAQNVLIISGFYTSVRRFLAEFKKSTLKYHTLWRKFFKGY